MTKHPAFPGSSRRARRLRALVAFVVGLALALTGATAALSSTNISSAIGTDYYLATGGGWRYGPAFIQDATGMHVYTCSPGPGVPWDVIRYSTSTNGGVSWSADQVVLQPNSGSADHYSTCDPGVVQFGGYYYLAYTSTVDARGTDNDVFVARSTSQSGPFDKWNGSGWGGNPAPIVTHTGPAYTYGAGEPSLVVVGSTLYLFYTWNSADPGTGKLIQQTRLATASTASANWPGSLGYQGVAIDRRIDQNNDSDDIKWVPAWNKFIAINSAQRFGPLSYIQAWESTNGLNFQPTNFDSSNLKRYLHNVGLSGDASGQLNPATQNYVGYAYGSTWGSWNTSIDPIALTNDGLPAAPQIYTQLAGNGSVRLEFQLDNKATSYQVKYGTTPGSYTTTVSGITASPYTLTGLTNGTTYYVTMTATGPGGTSSLGQDIAVMPQNWTALTLAAATAGSTTAGQPASNAIDLNAATFYSSVGHASASANEWLRVDTGSLQNLGRVVVTSRQPSQVASPLFDTAQHAVVQTSPDGTTWTTIDTRLTTSTIIDSLGVMRTFLFFPHPVSARYVRINATQLNADDFGNFYLQIADVGVDSVPGGPVASSALVGFPASNLTDPDLSTMYSSVQHATSAGPEWAGVDLGSSQAVTRLLVTPRASGYGFPTSFTLESSANGSTWTAIPGQSFSSYANPGSAQQSFTFSASVTARYFRLNATVLGADNLGNYYLQLADLTVDKSRLATATASSTANSTYLATNAVDQRAATVWSSAGHASASATEWVQLDFGSSGSFQNIWVDPNNQAFPSSFTLSSSTNGTAWTQLPGQVYTVYTDPASFGTSVPPSQLFHLTVPITARYLRITATALRPDTFGNYYFQVRDIRVTG